MVERLATEFRKFQEAVCQRTQFDDAERLQFITAHQKWSAKAWGSNEYVQYTIPGEDNPKLYMSTRNVPMGAQPPNITTNPSNWRLVAGQ